MDQETGISNSILPVKTENLAATQCRRGHRKQHTWAVGGNVKRVPSLWVEVALSVQTTNRDAIGPGNPTADTLVNTCTCQDMCRRCSGSTALTPSTQRPSGHSHKTEPQAAVTKNGVGSIVLIQKYLHDKNHIMFETYLFLNFNINVDLYNLLCKDS